MCAQIAELKAKIAAATEELMSLWLHWLDGRVWICLDWIEVNQHIYLFINILQASSLFPDLNSPNNL